MLHTTQSGSFRDARGPNLVFAALLIFVALAPETPAAVPHPLLAPRPGPIDRPRHIVSADFNRDGFDDLATADFEAGTISILINQRDGTFAPQAFSPVPVGPATFGSETAGPLYMIVADLNPNDADSDGVPNAQDNCPNVYNAKDAVSGIQPDTDNNGVGDACQLTTAVDTDQDGILDYNTAPNPAYRLDNCPLMYNPSQTDANNDGVGDACQGRPDDLAVVEKSLGTGFTIGVMRVRVNLGDGSFQSRPSKATGTGTTGLAAADFNGDGLLDLVLSNSGDDNLQLHPGTGDANYANQTYVTTGDGPEGLATGDLDGNGRADLAVANRSGNSVGLYFNPDAPAAMGLPLQPTVTLATQAQPTELLTARLGGPADLVDDLVVIDQGGSGAGMIEVYLGPLPKTPAVVPSPLVINLGAGHRPRGVAVRDLDLDGIPDLAVDDFSFDQVLIFKGAGNGTFSLAATIGPIDQPAAIAALDFDPNDPSGPDPDLAVLELGHSTIELFRNDGAMNFVRAATSPASPWKRTTGIELFGADGATGNDLLLVQSSPARLDVVAGIGNGFFRATPSIPLTGPTCTLPSGAATCADSMIEAELLQDTAPDLLITDTLGNKVTVVTGVNGTFPSEGQTLSVASDPIASAVGPLLSIPGDYDRDGVPDRIDNCPTRYNPPNCKVTDPGCDVIELCTDTSVLKTDCAQKDPVTQQCDSDGNGIGDQCQLLDAACANLDHDGDLVPDFNKFATPQDYDLDSIPNGVDNCPTISNVNQADLNQNGIGDACEKRPLTDTDLDGRPDYDVQFDTPGYLPQLTGAARIAQALDNCPTIYNPGQEDNNADNVGNACTLRSALDNCPWIVNDLQTDDDGNGVGNDCASPPNDIVAISNAPGALTILQGDGSGRFRETAFSPVTGLSGPASALVGPFGLICNGANCQTKSTGDIVLAERGVVGSSSDDRLRLFLGNGVGALASQPAVPAQGDPSFLLKIPEQSLCKDAHFLGTPDPQIYYDQSNTGPVIVALEPETSTLAIYLVSNSGLGAVPAHPTPLPVPATLAAVRFVDLNRDGLQDLVALSSGDGDPSTPNLTIYMGLGNGLFYTDPSFNPDTVPDGGTSLTTGFIDIQIDNTFPDVVVFDGQNGAPFVLLNSLRDRTDIDSSGRVDGFDLALLADAFGAERGENFIIQPNGTLAQSGSGYGQVLVASSAPQLGQDLGSRDPKCDRVLLPMSGAYGLPVDINLDGVVDGVDLAFLASQFGRKLQP